MTSPGHPEISPELRALIQLVLDRVDPTVRAAAAALTSDTLRGPGPCQQVWCPVCAVVALANGEQHPLLAVVAEHSVTLMTLLRAMVAEPPTADSAGDGQAASATDTDSGQEPSGRNGSTYQSIPIVIETEDAADRLDD